LGANVERTDAIEQSELDAKVDAFEESLEAANPRGSHRCELAGF